MHDKLHAFAYALAEWRSAMETDVQHVIVSMQADALATALRKASDERRRLRQEADSLLACRTHDECEAAPTEGRTHATCNANQEITSDSLEEQSIK
jgi:hypothetical protein